MAAPAVTGGVAQLLEVATALQAALPISTIKGLLLHTADDVGTHIGNELIPMAYHVISGSGGTMGLGGALFYWPDYKHVPDGPDYMTGYGQLNLMNAMRMVISGNPKGWINYNYCAAQTQAYPKLPALSPVAMGGPLPAGCANGTKVTTIDHLISVPANAKKLRVTLTYNDPAPAPGSPRILVNDLDLVVLDYTSQWRYYPWQLDPSCPYRQAVRLVAKCDRPDLWSDHLNNIEQVLVDQPPAGEWTARITASALPKGPQPFSLWISFE